MYVKNILLLLLYKTYCNAMKSCYQKIVKHFLSEKLNRIYTRVRNTA
jgi:hypothetical protein